MPTEYSVGNGFTGFPRTFTFKQLNICLPMYQEIANWSKICADYFFLSGFSGSMSC